MSAERTGSDPGWARYYAATAGRPPRPTLLRALDAFDGEPPAPGAPPRLALDLGCGTGRDTGAILARGWRALAVDAEPAALAALEAGLGPTAGGRLETRLADLAADTALPPADLANASFCLFFLPGPAFASLWAAIRAALRPGGRFAGQLLGTRDSWAAAGRCLGHDRAALEPLLAGYEVELIGEEENDGVTPRGEAKRWHVWHLNLRRPR